MKKTIGIVLKISLVSIVAQLIVHSVFAREYALDNALYAQANAINKHTPAQVDQFTRLDSAMYSNKTMNYFFTVTGVQTGLPEGVVLKVHYLVKEHARTSACSTPETRNLLGHGIKLKYIYSATDGSQLFNFSVNSNDCRQI